MPYTYLIGWSKFQKYYYGVRFAKNSTPKELWKTYFTSSKHVKKFRELHGEPDIIQVRKVFANVDEARLWETKVLKRMKVVQDNKWLNKTDNVSIDPEFSAVQKGKFGKEHNRYGSKNNFLSEYNKKNNSIRNKDYCRKGEDHHFYGKKLPFLRNTRAKEIVICPHCNKKGMLAGMQRWHMNNCKNKKET